MMPRDMHLTEEERQRLADGSLAPDREQQLLPHLHACATCASDVMRLRQVVRAARDSSALDAAASEVPLEELWSGIRARIEERQTMPVPQGAERRRVWSWTIAAVVAAAVVVLALSLGRGARTPEQALPTTAASADSLILVADSVRAYQEEARILLERLALQRAMLEPGTQAAIDHDLAVVDAAIAELQGAIARDPNDPRLQRLLAMSYRRKVDILERVEDAG